MRMAGAAEPATSAGFLIMKPILYKVKLAELGYIREVAV